MKRLARDCAVWLISTCVFGVAPPACSALVTLESATMGPAAQGAGLPVSATNFVGWRFKVTTSLAVTQVGGHLGGIDGNLFAAILPLTSLSALPTGAPFDSGVTVPTANFTAPSSTADIRVPLVTLLTPGSYALVFGSGQFNAVGSGWIPNSQQPNIAPTTQSTYITWRQTLPGHYAWSAGTLNNVRLVVVGNEVAGPTDFNQDGRIDGADLAAWKTSFTTPTSTPKADADGDGDIDGADLLAWQCTQAPTTGGSTSVPEPHILVLAAIAAAAALAGRLRAAR